MSPRTRYIKVFIGRFQPFHDGHLKALRATIDTADRVVVLIGSAQDQVPSLKNPFTFKERRAMIAFALRPEERAKVMIFPQHDNPGHDDEWVAAAKRKVTVAAEMFFPGDEYAYSLIGCNKGADTYYLNLYKGWNLELMPQSEALNATDIRASFFSPGKLDWANHLPGSSAAMLWSWKKHNYDGLYRKISKELNP